MRRKQPNPWGLYDMHGNVWEWCSDFFADYPQGELTDPQGPAQGLERVVRGGAWRESLSVCRSARRYLGNPQQRETSYAGIGFRVVLEEGGE